MCRGIEKLTDEIAAEAAAKAAAEATAKAAVEVAKENAKTKLYTGVAAYLDCGLDDETIIKKAMEKYGVSRENAAMAVEESKKCPDFFYAENNIKHLKNIVKDVKDGTAHFSEHDLIEK